MRKQSTMIKKGAFYERPDPESFKKKAAEHNLFAPTHYKSVLKKASFGSNINLRESYNSGFAVTKEVQFFNETGSLKELDKSHARMNTNTSHKFSSKLIASRSNIK